MVRGSITSVRQRLKNFTWLSDTPAMLCWAALMGVMGAGVVILFHEGIFAIQRLVAGDQGEITEIIRELPWFGRLLFPTVGGLIAGLLLWLASRKKTEAASDYMEAVAIGDGRMAIGQGVLRSLSSLFTVASGGSIGREGAMVHLSSLAASMLGRFIYIGTVHLRLLVASGGAAGVAAAYGAPLAAAVFVAEIVLGSLSMQSLAPLLIAAASANITMRLAGDYHAVYQMVDLQRVAGLEIWVFIILGVVTGVAAPGFLKLMSAGREHFVRTGIPLWLRLALGGFLVGLLLIPVPDVAGNGFSIVWGLLHENWPWYVILSMLFAKVLATVLTVGSGAIGGVFTPALVVGAAFGALFGQLMHGLFPELGIQPNIYILVGMGAFLGAATSAPLMAILMLFEMTLSYELVLPLIVASVIAYFVSRMLAEVAMYEVTLVRERDERLRHTLRHMRINELIRPADTVVATSTKVSDALQMFLEYPVKYIYVVDEHNVYQGVIAQQDLTRLLLHHVDAQEHPVGEVLRSDFVKTLDSKMSLDEAQQYFVNFQGERLPVLSLDESPRLLGVVYKSALLEKYTAIKRSLDSSSEALFNVRPGAF